MTYYKNKKEKYLESQLNEKGYKWTIGKGQTLATAIHHGHWIRPEVLEYIALEDSERYREEDPYTGDWTNIGEHQLIVNRSRFECDLNRIRENAVYEGPESAWGLNLYNKNLPRVVRERSLQFYDDFYQSVEYFISNQLKHYSHFLIIDLHSYNHRRNGPKSKPADIVNNPEINLGTFYIKPPEYWSELIEVFESTLQNYNLNVKHNMPFKGGDFSQWINRTWKGRVCALTVEVKKNFMDEWTGKKDMSKFKQIGIALEKATSAAKKILKNLQ